MCNCNNKYKPAIVRATLAGGSETPPYYYLVNILQELCRKGCADGALVFSPVFKFVGAEQVGISQWIAHMNVTGLITYMPCGCGTCGSKSVPVDADFDIPIFSAAPITSVVPTPGTPDNDIKTAPCHDCGCVFECIVPMTLVVTNV